MKDILKIVVLLVVLVAMVGGFWYLFKDQKVFEHKKSNNDTTEVRQEEKEETQKKEEPKKEEVKQEEKKTEQPKQETKTTPKPNTNTTSNTKKVIDFKYITCRYQEPLGPVEDYDGIDYIFTASFPVYQNEAFSRNNELHSSNIQIVYNLAGYKTLNGEQKKLVDEFLDELYNDFPGYSRSRTNNGNVIQFSLKGDKTAFKKAFDDFKKDKVTYDNYLAYFKENRITCSES